MLSDNFGKRILRADNFLGGNLDVGRLARGRTRRLVQHDAGMRERVALALRAGSQQHRAH